MTVPSAAPCAAVARLALLAAAALALAACGDDRPAARADSAAAAAVPVDSALPPDSAAPGAPASGWNAAELGPALFVAGDDDGQAVAVLPGFVDSTLTDTTTFDLGPVRDAQVELFGPGGLVGAATVQSALAAVPAARRADDEDAGCPAWAPVRLATATTGELPRWRVAFARGRATPLVLDSIGALAGGDSTRLAVQVTRLASAVRDSAGSRFIGLPFAVRGAYRFAPAPGVTAVAATLVRKVNQEASAREEHTLVVAEREGEGEWRLAYSERAAGGEEVVVVAEPLAAVRIGGAAALVVERSYSDGVRYALLERAAARRWRVRWRSAYAGC